MRRAFPFLFAACLGLCSAAHAGQERWTAASDTDLDALRGGFAAAPGLLVSFGIVRTVRIDGHVVNHTALHLEDLRSITLAQARALGEQLRGAAVVQSGARNTVAAALAPTVAIAAPEMGGASTPDSNAGNAPSPVPAAPAPVVPNAVALPALIVQNTESNRHLQAVTEIHAVTNGLRLLNGIQLGRSLTDALAGALGR